MQRIELGIVLRIGTDNLPVILASLRNKALLRQVLRTAIADAERRARQADPLAAAGAHQEGKTLRSLLARLGSVGGARLI